MNHTSSEALGMKQIMNVLPQTGQVTWMGIRTQRKAPLTTLAEVAVSIEHGLAGDHYGRQGGNRQVTLIQAEHLEAVAGFLGKTQPIDPMLARRNIVVRGINLLAFANRQFIIGEVVLEMTGICHPCTRFEQTLGPGAYNAMRGHGGITAKVITGGTIRLGDPVALYIESPTT